MENLNQTNSTAIVEKVSKKNIKSEKTQLELEENNALNNLLKAAMKLSSTDIKKAIAFIRKKREILKKN